MNHISLRIVLLLHNMVRYDSAVLTEEEVKNQYNKLKKTHTQLITVLMPVYNNNNNNNILVKKKAFHNFEKLNLIIW